MEIATGHAEQHPNVLPIDATATPGVQRPTEIQPGQQAGPTYPALDTVAMNLEQQRQGEADAAAAMSAGMAADKARRDHYAADVLPQGAAYGDAMDLPPVPSAAVPPAMSDEYPYAGMGRPRPRRGSLGSTAAAENAPRG